MRSILTIVIPAYNEAESLPLFLPKVLEHCQASNYQLIIINDASTDATPDILNAHTHHSFFTCIHHPANKGYGGAIKTGIQAAQTPYVITIDADGQHNLEDVDKILRFIQQQQADIVIGARPRKAETSWFRAIGKYLLHNITRLLLPITIDDINSGMKLYRTELAQVYIHHCPDGMPFSDSMGIVFTMEGKKVAEFPITINPRLAGESTINLTTAIRTFNNSLKFTWKYRPFNLVIGVGVLLTIVIGGIWTLLQLLA